MGETAIAILAAGSAIAGVVVTVVADGLKDKRRIRHELEIRDAERVRAAADRRRTFELDNLLAAYDGLRLLARRTAKGHGLDLLAAKDSEHGYGGTLRPETDGDVEAELATASQAGKAIRLILDDDVRRLAQEAHQTMTDLGLLGVKARMFGRGPVGVEEADAVMGDVARRVDAAMNAIADRVRVLTKEM